RLVMLTMSARRPPVSALGLPRSETSAPALPPPDTFSSSLAAASFARSVSADTEASKAEAAADADEAAADADASAEAAAELIGAGGMPEKEAVSGGVGRGLNVLVD
ncbi:hypothetical protein ACFWAX_31045, partial [Streptomyces sp. NPDC059956]